MFFTGPAGTGKSVLLRAIIAAFKKRGREGSQEREGFRERDAKSFGGMGRRGWNLAVTASTGMAAV
jgi:ATP-dependent DNA helicase PIF1